MSVARERLLDSTEVAEWLNIPRSTLDYWAQRGEGPKFTKIGSKRRYAVEDVKSYIASGEVEVVARGTG
jgi:excisionase family DNA binding protein